MSLIRIGLDRHKARLTSTTVAGEPISVRRGATTVTVNGAVRGKSTFDDSDGDGETVVSINSVDWIIPTSEYTHGEPRRGDEITDSGGDVYDLLPGMAGKSWEYVDAHETFIRLYTVRRQRGFVVS